ncbi:mesenteric estrogen-dependent adipogenesis protein-like isoform X1 [Micropterus salmoides]|uniref:mesenteric estrogen-dependent adipogenesis protein-like n=1 Tax=Micropterus dolomieu TaxID=147949 RepID=UPI0018EA7E23|nr:mesenteric estrogen-dependent adipogenesis protein-like isoform X1 [Micropterus salmoides]XP_045896715.1 mesenteric estrogen-dependent adipogenesis protein-like [Micropterus dolomieu]
MTATEVEEFLRNPPDGFSVEVLGSGYRVHSDPEKSLVFIDAINSSRGKIVFQNSLGRKFKMHDLWEYTSMRKSLLSKRIYLLGSVCEDKTRKRKKISASKKKAAKQARVLQQYVLSIDGNNPFIKWQMEKGLDWTIASVAGESYRVDIDLSELLESWAAENVTDKPIKVKPVWRDASFTLKYYSDAFFDFPHQFGFSKRTFKLRPI